MDPKLQLLGRSFAQSRREFLAVCGLLALAACGAPAVRPLAPRPPITPELEQWRPVLHALIETLVAFDDARLPRTVTAERVSDALLAYFPLGESEAFVPLRRGLLLFDDTESFPERLPPFVEDERVQGTQEAAIERAVAHDSAAFSAASVTGSFRRLSLLERRRYLSLWASSAFTARRRFYRSSKAMTMIATYSLPELWQAIGYEGPLLG